MSGFENMVSMFVNVSFDLSGSTAPLMVCIPNIRIANPSMMLPIFLYTDRLQNIRRMMPPTATTAVIVAVDRIFAIPPDPSI